MEESVISFLISYTEITKLGGLSLTQNGRAFASE